ncbi:hypothetical protein ACFX13_021008 [Malus domestica]|uniref:Uncharacterized protein n=1 Tax=Malus domestica TaxID=3750 RepID=A0A498HFF7_MALDO|nr:hypothetical protein DVH24_007462 [Malus domestica]
MTEHFDTPQVLQETIEQLTIVIQKSKHLVVFTGTGISTFCCIPDFQGPMGIWTLQEKKPKKKPIFPKILWIQMSQFLGKFQEMKNRTRYLHQMESVIFSPRQFLFHVHCSTAGHAHLRIHVTDFHWKAVCSVSQLDNLRDNIGIRRSWLEFIDYLVTSLKSQDVKLVFDDG